MNDLVGDPLDARPGEPSFVWLRGHDGFAAWGCVRSIDVEPGPDAISRAGRALAGAFADLGVPPTSGMEGPVACGSFTFDPGSQGSLLFIPGAIAWRLGDRSFTVTMDPTRLPAAELRSAPPERIRYAGSTRSEIEWLDAVAQARDAVAAGRFDKIVLARDVNVWAESDFDSMTLVRRLRDRFPDCFTFACAGLVGASPELLVRRVGSSFESVVLAGSAPRGLDAQTDGALASELLSSQKDRREHEISVASVTDALAGHVRELNVADPAILRLQNVQHLSTVISGTLAGDESALDLVGLLHPTAAVCGSPRPAAFSALRGLEGIDRGRYAGPIGWSAANGDGEWAIALRCGEFDGSRGRLFAGSGIVAASVPEDELEETRVKLKAIQSALEGRTA